MSDDIWVMSDEWSLFFIKKNIKGKDIMYHDLSQLHKKWEFCVLDLTF